MSLIQAQTVTGEAKAAPLECERDLVERAKRDPKAFGALYERYRPTLVNYVYRRTDIGTEASRFDSGLSGSRRMSSTAGPGGKGDGCSHRWRRVTTLPARPCAPYMGQWTTGM